MKRLRDKYPKYINIRYGRCFSTIGQYYLNYVLHRKEFKRSQSLLNVWQKYTNHNETETEKHKE